jgi:tripartite-type tricarboxylate transporter receptor subunit TctC
MIRFAAGGGTDVMAHKLLPFVEKRVGGKAKFVVLNKPGAGGEIAFASIARAASARTLISSTLNWRATSA